MPAILDIKTIISVIPVIAKVMFSGPTWFFPSKRNIETLQFVPFSPLRLSLTRIVPPFQKRKCKRGKLEGHHSVMLS